jgi:hypothetical protein
MEMNFAAIAFVGSVRVTNCYFEPEVLERPLGFLFRQFHVIPAT